MSKIFGHRLLIDLFYGWCLVNPQNSIVLGIPLLERFCYFISEAFSNKETDSFVPRYDDTCHCTERRRSDKAICSESFISEAISNIGTDSFVPRYDGTCHCTERRRTNKAIFQTLVLQEVHKNRV